MGKAPLRAGEVIQPHGKPPNTGPTDDENRRDCVGFLGADPLRGRMSSGGSVLVQDMTDGGLDDIPD